MALEVVCGAAVIFPERTRRRTDLSVLLRPTSVSPGRRGRYETPIGLSPRPRARIVAALDRYAETRHGDVAKLAGIDPPEYRLRVGPWRVRFAWDQAAGVVTVLHVFGRGRGYE